MTAQAIEGSMAQGILAVAFDYSNTHTDEFHDWYDLEHVPERQAISGFGACDRWLDDGGAEAAVATYDLASIDVLRSEAYRAIAYDNSSVWTKRIVGMCERLLRFEGVRMTPGDEAAPANAGGLLVNAMNVAAEAEDDFNAWYNEEHIPALAAVPGTMLARRYRADENGSSTHKYLAIYHLESPEVTRTEAWAKAVDTPWSARVRPHFQDRLRLLTKRYQRSV